MSLVSDGNRDESRVQEVVGKCVELIKRGPVAFWLIALALNVPLMVLYLRSVWRQEHYQYIPFLLAAIGYLAWARIPIEVIYPQGRLSRFFFALSIAVLLIASLVLSPWAGSVAFVLLAASFLFNHHIGYLTVPLLLMIRAPRGYDSLVITWLQGLTTRISSFMLDLFSVPHLVQGNVIELADRELFVAEACSGVQSAFTIAFITLLVVAWRRRPLVLIPIYLVIALMWAVLCNTLRVTTIAYAAAYAQVDLSTGFVHDLIGYAALIVAILLTLSTDSLLAMCFRPVGGEFAWQDNPVSVCWNWMFSPNETAIDSDGDFRLSLEDDSERETTFPAQASETRGVNRWAMTLIASVALLSLLPYAARATLTANVANPAGDLLVDPSPKILDGLDTGVRVKFAQSMRNGRDPRLGMHADQWSFQFSGLVGAIIFSQPYPEWHNLNICYAGSGWVVTSSQYLRPGGDSRDRTEVILSRFQRGDGTNGYLFFTGLSSDGGVLSPPGVGVVRQIFERCSNWLTPRLEFSGDTAMLQLWVTSPTDLDPQTIAVLVDTLALARDRFSDQMKDARGASLASH